MRENKWVLFAFGVIAYAVAYIAVWFTRSHCDAVAAVPCAVEAAMKGGGDLIQFAWVWENPEIAASALTVGAAFTVFVTLNQQRQWALSDARSQRRDQSLAAIINVRHAFQRTFNCLYAFGDTRQNLNWPRLWTALEKAIENARIVLSANAAAIGAEVSTSCEIVLSDIEDTLRAAPAGVFDSREIRLATAMTALVGRYLHDPNLLIGEDGRCEGEAIPAPEGFISRLENLDLTIDSLNRTMGIPVEDFFILPNEVTDKDRHAASLRAVPTTHD